MNRPAHDKRRARSAVTEFVTLWTAAHGLHCVLVRRNSQPFPLEILIVRGARIIKSAVFDDDEPAAAFALAEMRAAAILHPNRAQ
jgi:hypothetical protein